MIDYIQRASTVHYYEDGSFGERSWDGDWDTNMYKIISSHRGPSDINMVSRHTFTSKKLIKQIDFRVYTYARAALCQYGYNESNSWAFQYWNSDTGLWTTFPGASGSDASAAHVTLTKDDFGQIRSDKIQMIANAHANTSCSQGDANQETEAGGRIYEMQAWVKPKAYAIII